MPKSRQILLVTDGKSNGGYPPIEAAALAYRRKIVVNVIGIGGRRPLSRRAVAEIEGIAQAGGGFNKLVNLNQMVQSIRNTMLLTNARFTHQSSTTVFPEVIEGPTHTLRQLAHETHESELDVLVLVDTSASMMNKLEAVRVALYQFVHLMRMRHVKSRFSVYTYPAVDSVTSIVSRQTWTSHAEYLLPSLFKDIRMGGITPTGSAILSATGEFDSPDN